MTQAVLEAQRLLSPGERFEGHQIVELIARGGRSFIYKALHTATGELNTLKIRTAPLPPDGAPWFRENAKALPSVQHPNLERTFAGGVASDGRVWFTAELLRGVALEADLARRGPLPSEEATVIARQLARGLEALHEAGYLHRNLKPANVFLLDDGNAKLLDVGLSMCTRREQPMSTPQTTSPEEIQHALLDERSDVYSLGALVFQLVTGRPVFEGDLQSVFHGHLYDPPPRLRALRPEAQALQEIVNRALSKRPANRFPSMRAMAEALEAAGRT